jgi:O-antigen/teichoic acid export membrane protein
VSPDSSIRGVRSQLLALRQRPVIAAASSLFGSTLITSFLGFAFWAVAARFYSPADVGTASAGISAMQFLATVGVLGLGTLVIAEVRQPSGGHGLISAAAVVASVASSLTAVLYVLVAPLIHAHLGPLGQGVGGVALFVAGVGFTGLTIVLDQACIGLLRGGLQFWRNAVFAAVKLVLLPLGVLLPTLEGALLLYGAWLLGNAISLMTFYVHVRRMGLHPRLRPHWSSLGTLRGSALSHHWLNLSSSGPRLILPIIVTSMLGPEQNAAFYAALLLVTFANIVPVHLTTALFSLARGDTDALARESRHTLWLSVLVSVASGALFLLASSLLLRLIGREYVFAAFSMAVLGLTTLPLAIKSHYMAICRVHDRLNRCALVITVGGVLELLLAAGGAAVGGLVGVSTGYLLGLVIEALVLWPTVAKAAGMPLFLISRKGHRGLRSAPTERQA